LKSGGVTHWKVFIGPVEISGIAGALAEGLRALQVDAQVMLSTAHPFKYGNESQSWLVRVWQGIGAARNATNRDRLLRKLLLVAAHDLWGWLVFLCAIARFDAFIFIFGQTITNSSFELWLLKRLGRKIIFVYAGSDSRPPYMDGGLFPGLVADDLPSAAALLSTVRRCKRKLRLHERYADYLVNSPSTAHFHERPYINWFALGIPKALPVCPQVISQQTYRSRSVRVLHGPSNPLAKGTVEILDVVERLQRKGYSIELVKIQGMPNEVVLQELARCDFIVDQLYADTPMAALATEAAFFGKPAVVGGYFADSIEQYLEPDDIPPSLFIAPDELEMAIERLVVDSVFRLQLGEQARQFVLSRWTLAGVAGRYLQLLNDDIPKQWWCDPAAVRYLNGGGLPDGRTRRLVALLVDHFGASALQVQDKPELERALVEFARVVEEPTDA
jgi:glycosyltransferase involved in cell wall biosynthesis